MQHQAEETRAAEARFVRMLETHVEKHGNQPFKEIS
jgi:hypothetical protein